MARIIDRSRWTRAVAMASIACCMHGPAQARDPAAASPGPSEVSAASVALAGSVVVGGSLVAMSLAGRAVVASVEAVGDGTVIVLRGLSDTGIASVRVAGRTSIAVGSVVEVVALSTGCALMQSGRMIAFIPNAIGRSLLYQRPVAALR